MNANTKKAVVFSGPMQNDNPRKIAAILFVASHALTAIRSASPVTFGSTNMSLQRLVDATSELTDTISVNSSYDTHEAALCIAEFLIPYAGQKIINQLLKRMLVKIAGPTLMEKITKNSPRQKRIDELNTEISSNWNAILNRVPGAATILTASEEITRIYPLTSDRVKKGKFGEQFLDARSFIIKHGKGSQEARYAH